MNKYIIAVADLNENVVWTDYIMARSTNEAKDKYISKFARDHDTPYCSDWEEFLDEAYDCGYLLGDIIDVELI